MGWRNTDTPPLYRAWLQCRPHSIFNPACCCHCKEQSRKNTIAPAQGSKDNVLHAMQEFWFLYISEKHNEKDLQLWSQYDGKAEAGELVDLKKADISDRTENCAVAWFNCRKLTRKHLKKKSGIEHHQVRKHKNDQLDIAHSISMYLCQSAKLMKWEALSLWTNYTCYWRISHRLTWEMTFFPHPVTSPCSFEFLKLTKIVANKFMWGFCSTACIFWFSEEATF